MFIKRNRSRRGDAEYQSVLLVQGERVPAKRGPGRPKAGQSRPTTVVHRTLANLSNLPPQLIEIIESYCRADHSGESISISTATPQEPIIGRAYGAFAGLYAVACKMGIEKALGQSRMGRLAMFLVLARVIHRGSRLSATRWAETQAVQEVLGRIKFDENDLYEALDWICGRQDEIEKSLFKDRPQSTVYLYDVTSSYFEGQKNELAAHGYNRDGKRFKKQIVVGLMTDADGEPVSVRVYEGNTSDPKTVADQVRKLATEFGAKDVALVGDRGMLKGPQRELLGENGLRYISSLTDSEVRKKLSSGTLQLDLFEEKVAEVVEDGVRYILRRNPATADRHSSRRSDQLATVQKKVDARNEALAKKPRMSIDKAVDATRNSLSRYKLDSFISARNE